MRSSRIPVRWWVTGGALGATVILGIAALTGNAASADPGHHARSRAADCAAAAASAPMSESAPSESAASESAATRVTTRLARLQRRMGDRMAGSWLDAAGHPVVAVTDAASARQAQQEGAVAHCVERDGTELRAGMSVLDAQSDVPGTAWSVDPATNQIVVSYDSTVAGSDLERLRTTVAGLGDMARTEAAGGRFTTRLSGGDAIFGRGGQCSLGFAVDVQGSQGFLTAGHCGNAIRNWTANGRTLLGRTVASSFPGNDFALVQVVDQNAGLTGTVGRQDITTAATPVVGQRVTRRGSTTGVHRGRVTALDVTVNFPEGRVGGLIRTTVCAEPGDSGGPLFSGTTALGLTSGGNGDCTRGGTTFFQPVTEALDAFGATLE